MSQLYIELIIPRPFFFWAFSCHGNIGSQVLRFKVGGTDLLASWQEFGIGICKSYSQTFSKTGNETKTFLAAASFTGPYNCCAILIPYMETGHSWSERCLQWGREWENELWSLVGKMSPNCYNGCILTYRNMIIFLKAF